MEHALPRRTAGTPRTWSLCMTSENHGTVGPAGCKFSHAPEKHERVQVVEIVAAGSPPAPGVDLSGLMRFGFCDINDDEFVERPDGAYFLAHQVEERVTSAPAAKPVGEFKGYVDGQPAVTWFDRDNMPRVGTKLYAEPVAAQAGHAAPSEELARFCPACGSVGDVGPAYRDCCPDGNEARLIPKRLAEKCHELFKVALSTMRAAAPSPAKESK